MAVLVVVTERAVSKTLRAIRKLKANASGVLVLALCEKAERVLKKNGIPHKNLRSYYQLPELANFTVVQFDKTVELLRECQRSIITDGICLNELLTYQGVPLWDVVSHQLALHYIAPLMNTLTVAQCIVGREKPAEVFLSTDDNSVCRGIFAVSRQNGIRATIIQKASLFLRSRRQIAGYLKTLVVQLRDCFIEWGLRLTKYRCKLNIEAGSRNDNLNKILFLNVSPIMLKTILPVARAAKDDYKAAVLCVLLRKVNTPRELLQAGIPFRFFEAYVDWRISWSEIRSMKNLAVKWCCEIEGSRMFKHSSIKEAQAGEQLLKEVILAHLRKTLSVVMRNLRTSKILLETEKPKAIISAEDFSPVARTLFLLGQTMGIPSVRIQQETLIPPNGADWAFLISDKATVCGEYAQEILVKKRGIEPERLFPVGQPRYDELVNASNARGAVGKKYGIPEGNRIILFASIPPSSDSVPRLEGMLSQDEYSTWIRQIYSACLQMDNCFVLVKPHPQKNDSPKVHLATWGRVADKRKDRKKAMCVTDRYCNILELIAACDVLITWESITAIEAMLLGKPVVIVNLTGREDLMPYVSAGAALGAYRQEEIAPRLKDALENMDVINMLRQTQKRFLERVFYKIDGRAASRAAAFIHSLIKDRPQPGPPTVSVSRETLLVG